MQTTPLLDLPAKRISTLKVALLLGAAIMLAGVTLNQVVPSAGAEDYDIVVRGNSEFALDVYRELVKSSQDQRENCFFSPYSLSTALAMTYLGAGGATAAQMAETLHLSDAPDQVKRAFKDLIDEINRSGDKKMFELSVANALWGERTFDFLEPFIIDCDRFFHGQFQPLNFVTESEKSRRIINDWVAERTKDRILDLLPDRSIDPLTTLVLTNAIYFKSNWLSEFKEHNTRDELFTLLGGEEIDTPLMRKTGHYGYFEDEYVQVLEIPYKGRELAMTIILPRAIDGLPAIEARLEHADLNNWITSLTDQSVEVYLPKFKINDKFEGKNILSRLGMADAFKSGIADFSKMTTQENLFIGQVYHKAFIEVDESGTEAAAATAVVMMYASAPARQPEPLPVFRADHPFLFLIRHCESNSILFMGRLADPDGR